MKRSTRTQRQLTFVVVLLIAGIESGIAIADPQDVSPVVFPNGVPVAMLEGEQQDRVQAQSVAARNNGKPSSQKLSADSVHASKGEGNLRSISDEIQRHSDEVEDNGEENLID